MAETKTSTKKDHPTVSYIYYILPTFVFIIVIFVLVVSTND